MHHAFVSAPVRLHALTARRGLPICSRKRGSQVRAPARMSLLPLIPNWAVLGAWIYGGYRFFKGYRATSYQSSFRIPLALTWPIFMIVNGRFRENFFKALRSGDD